MNLIEFVSTTQALFGSIINQV